MNDHKKIHLDSRRLSTTLAPWRAAPAVCAQNTSEWGYLVPVERLTRKVEDVTCERCRNTLDYETLAAEAFIPELAAAL